METNLKTSVRKVGCQAKEKAKKYEINRDGHKPESKLKSRLVRSVSSPPGDEKHLKVAPIQSLLLLLLLPPPPTHTQLAAQGQVPPPPPRSSSVV